MSPCASLASFSCTTTSLLRYTSRHSWRLLFVDTAMPVHQMVGRWICVCVSVCECARALSPADVGAHCARLHTQTYTQRSGTPLPRPRWKAGAGAKNDVSFCHEPVMALLLCPLEAQTRRCRCASARSTRCQRSDRGARQDHYHRCSPAGRGRCLSP